MDIKALPSIERCRRTFQSLAILDAIIMPEWEYRYYSFNSKWDENEMMASMRNGSGEDYFGLFNQHGLIIKGFEKNLGHGVDKTVFTGLPTDFSDFLHEPAFSIDETTFCIWNLEDEGIWHAGKNYGPNELRLLNALIDGADGYKRWAEGYYEVDLPLNTIIDIFNFEPLNENRIRSLNRKMTLNDLRVDIDEINYPVYAELV